MSTTPHHPDSPPDVPAARPPGKPGRLLVVLPSWLGDVVMATPTLRLLRDALPGSFIAGLARPSVASLLEGTPLLDEIIIERASGVMGPKRVAARVRPLRFDAALLLTNSFSTALTTRIAGIPRRVGYDRDGRGLLLTHRLHAPERSSKGVSRRRWAAVPACAYYFAAGRALLGDPPPPFEELDDAMRVMPPGAALELPLSESDREQADRVLAAAGVGPHRGDKPTDPQPHFVVLNPGANNPAKRWPAERFAEIADGLASRHGLRVLVNSGPGEEDVARALRDTCRTADPVLLAEHGQTLASLKAILACARLLVTNDTGPRHLAAAFGTPTVTLFGPTDPRWTILPEPASDMPLPPREIRLAAGEIGPDPLGPDELADEHPERCRIDRIPADLVRDAADRLLSPLQAPNAPPSV